MDKNIIKLKEETIELFSDWLISEKGYPRNSISKNIVVRRKTEDSLSTFKSDLTIIDIFDKSELAIVEFKNSIKSISDNEINLIMMSLAAIQLNDLQYFVIIPFDKSFKIYSVDKNGILPLVLQEFPSYQSLISNSHATKKLEKLKKAAENKRKTEILKTTLLATIISLIVALLFSNQYFKNNSLFKSNLTNKEIDTTTQKIIFELKQIKSKISKFETLKIDSSKKTNIEFSDLNKRLSTIETLINQNPKNLLEVQDLNYKINFLTTNVTKEKELYEFKLKSIEDKLDTYITIIFTLVVTIIGSLTAFTISTFKK